ncbi:hypothetical protein L9F63_000065, partial [Diploptera punctata]
GRRFGNGETAVSELISTISSLWSTGVMSFLGGFLLSSMSGRPEATDDGDKLRSCSLEEKGYETCLSRWTLSYILQRANFDLDAIDFQ